MESFEFKESLLQRTMFTGFCLIAASLTTIACLIKITDSLVWLIGGLLAGAVTAAIALFLFQSYRTRQFFRVDENGITSQSKDRGTITLLWEDLEAVREGKGKISNIREAIPGLEVFITSYVMLPSTGSGERLGTLYLSDKNGQFIYIRQYLVYPSSLDKFLALIEFYSPISVSTTLKENFQN
jgi:hypothetical protein